MFFQYLKKNTLTLLTLLSWLGFLIKYSMQAYLASHMPASIYGDFNLALRTLMVASTLLLVGTHVSTRKYLGSYLHSKDIIASHYISWNLRFIGKFMAVCLSLSFGLFFLMCVIHFIDLYHLSRYHIALFALLISPIAAFSLLFTNILLSAQHVFLATLFKNTAEYVLLFIFFYVGIYFLKIPMNHFSSLSVLFCSYLTLFVIEGYFTFKKVPQIRNKEIKNSCLPHKFKKKWRSTSLQLMSNSISMMLVNYLDIMLIEVLLTNEAVVGYYAAAITVSSFISVLPLAVYQKARSKLGQLLADKKTSEIAQLFSHANRINFPITLISAIILAWGTPILLGHFGTQYNKAYTTCLLLVANNVLYALRTPLCLYVSYHNEEKKLNISSAASLIILITLGIPMTLYFGITGTAAATLLGTLSGFGILIYSTWSDICTYKILSIK